MLPSAGDGVLARPTLPLPRVAGRRPHTYAMILERSFQRVFRPNPKH